MANATATLRNAFRSRAANIVASAGVGTEDTIILAHQLTAQSVGGMGASGSAQNLTLAVQAISNYEFYVTPRGPTAAQAVFQSRLIDWNGSLATFKVSAASTVAGFVFDIVAADPTSPNW